MLKKLITTLAISCSFMMIIPTFNAHAAAKSNVSNQAELKEALADESITTITLSENIETTEKINITRPVTIDGNGHTIKYVGTFGAEQSPNNTTWGGIYVLQVYKTTATIKDIKLTGGNAALLINGSKVTLEGKIDVSGNGFGGIELGQGSGVEEISKIVMDGNTDIINTTENNNNPTIWVPDDSDDAIIEIDGITKTIESGEELALEEVMDLFDTGNPPTGDSITLTLLLGLLGISMFLNSCKTLKQN